MLRTLKERGSYSKRLKNEAAHICDDYGFYIKYHDSINKISQLIWYFDISPPYFDISKYHDNIKISPWDGIRKIYQQAFDNIIWYFDIVIMIISESQNLKISYLIWYFDILQSRTLVKYDELKINERKDFVENAV